MKDNRALYILASALLVALLLFLFRSQERVPEKVVIKKVARSILPIEKPEEKGLYDIDRYRPKAQGFSGQPPANLEEVYKNFPASDVGDNMIEGWAKCNPKDRARFIDGLEKEISVAKEALKANPDDKKARFLLAISESIKKLASDNFNHGKVKR